MYLYRRLWFTHFWTNCHKIQTAPCILFVLTAVDKNLSLTLPQIELTYKPARSHPICRLRELYSDLKNDMLHSKHIKENVELNSPLFDVMYIINVTSQISLSSILKSIRSNKTTKENSSQDAPHTDEEAVHSRQTTGN